jgi:hypothetical protein
MTVNKLKSGIMILNDDLRKKTGEQLNNYPIVIQYKYLGYWINKCINPKKQLEMIEKRCNFIKYKILTLGRNSHEFKDRLNLMKVLIKPHYLYGIVMLNYMSKTNQNIWIHSYKMQCKNFCGIGK